MRCGAGYEKRPLQGADRLVGRCAVVGAVEPVSVWEYVLGDDDALGELGEDQVGDHVVLDFAEAATGADDVQPAELSD